MGKVAGFISLLSFVPYIYSIVKGHNKPNRASWLIWTFVGLILAWSYYVSGGDTKGWWVPISYVIGPFLVFIFSLKKGEDGWNRFDRVCLFSVALSLILWFIFNNALIAFLTNILIDFFGALPTLRKSFYRPWEENLSGWVFAFLGFSLNFFAIQDWTFTTLVYLIYNVTISGAIVIILKLARLKRSVKLYKNA